MVKITGTASAGNSGVVAVEVVEEVVVRLLLVVVVEVVLEVVGALLLVVTLDDAEDVVAVAATEPPNCRTLLFE